MYYMELLNKTGTELCKMSYEVNDITLVLTSLNT